MFHDSPIFFHVAHELCVKRVRELSPLIYAALWRMIYGKEIENQKNTKLLDIDKQFWYALWLLRRTKATRISEKKFQKVKNCLTWTGSSDKIMNCCCEWWATRFRKKLENKMKKFLTNRNAYDKLNKLSEKQNKCSSKRNTSWEGQHLDK